jgi:hypothetical protein
MTDSIDRSIIQLKLRCPFVVLAIFTLYHSFLEKVWRFFIAMAKNGEH